MEIPSDLRRLVFERAGGRCEYCLLPQNVSGYRHEPDHIIPIQHGGVTSADNLALACIRCNRYKGPNIGSIDPESNLLTPFYNPRTSFWEEHFYLEDAIIQPKTPQARVTIKILRLNDPLRIEERSKLISLRLYPS